MTDQRIANLERFRDIIIDEKVSLGESHKDYDDCVELFNVLIEERKSMINADKTLTVLIGYMLSLIHI